MNSSPVGHIGVSYLISAQVFCELSFSIQTLIIVEQFVKQMSLMSQHLQRQSLNKPHMGSPFRKQYSFQSKYAPTSYLRYDQPQSLLQYQLARQKQKTRLLEQRLKNKEIFISQMKEFQNELTQAFDESQQELAFYKARCEQDANTQLRSQMEDELRQRVAVLEMEKRRVEEDRDREVREIRDRERKSLGMGRDRSVSGRSLQKSKTDYNLNVVGKENGSWVNEKNNASQLLAKSIGCAVEQVMKEMKHIGKFLNYFITMATTCNTNFPTNGLKQQLKVGWKWIKSIVKQNNDHRQTVKPKEQNQIQTVAKLLNVSSVDDIEPELENILHQARQTSRIIRMVTELCGLPEQSSLKHVEKSLKEKIAGK